MTTILIPIARETIRKNPAAGATVSYLTGHLRAEEIRCRRVGDGSNYVGPTVRWERQKLVGYAIENLQVADGIVVASEQFNLGIGEPPPDRQLSCSRSLQPIYHDRLPDYLFEYESISITCNHCEAMFPHSQLADDYWDDDARSNEVCPVCNAWGCCPPLQFERLNRDELATIAAQNEEPKCPS